MTGKNRMKKAVLLAISLALAIASTANAIEISVIGPDFGTVDSGEAFTINLAVENASGTSTVGVEGDLSGMAAAGAVVVSGQSATDQFVLFCSQSGCFGGLQYFGGAFWNPNDLPSSGNYTPGDDSIQVVNSISASGSTTSETGAIDPGLDGAINEPSARDVTISLIASVVGVHVLTISGDYSDGTQVIGLPGTTFTVTVVPEPGSALLLALGLFGLSTSRCRFSREYSSHPQGGEF